ncbi:hypothetical protein QYY96_12125, partial [Xanthomonas campestris pv. campestris]|uniref:hypothetical protein n=1 Tax=Xanthomonas campestris TaxID=339 RepID=UPI002AD4D265
QTARATDHAIERERLAYRAQGRSYEIRAACVADGRSLAHPVIRHGQSKNCFFQRRTHLQTQPRLL